VRCVGIDPSLQHTGLSDGVHTWTVDSAGEQKDSLAQRWDRLNRLRSLITAVGTPDLVVIEGTYASRFGHMHDRSGLWWLVVADLMQRRVPLAAVPPKTLKLYACGSGNAGKDDMQLAALERLPRVDLGERKAGRADRADALWLAAIGYDHLGAPLCGLPDRQRAAMAGVEWPQVAVR
jgi:crossover junction endodeoxyribonuclease RuvC